MSQQFLKNLYNLKSKVILLTLLSFNLLAQTGLVQTYQNYLTKKNTEFDLLQSSLVQSSSDWDKDYQEVYLDKRFLNSILFFTPKRFLKLGTKDKCSFYDLVLSNTLKDKNGEIQNFLVTVVSKDKKIQNINLKRSDFIQFVVAKECPQSINFSLYFTTTNLRTTLKKFSFKVPKNRNECSEVHSYYVKDHKTPYFCYLNQEINKISPLSNKIALTPTSDYKKLEDLKNKIRKARDIDSAFNDSAKSYLNNICQNIDKEKQFCDFFFDENYFKMIKEKTADASPILNICMELFNRNDPKILAICIDKILANPALCIQANKLTLGLYPRPNCTHTSTALLNSRLKSNVNDCPSLVQNDTIVNISRLVRHFSGENVNAEKDCKLNALSVYAAYNLKFNGEKYWSDSVCFDDKINDKEVCYPTLFGDSANNEISLSNNIRNILSRKRGLSKNATCKVIDSKSYNPVILKYQSGCFVLLPPKDCTENCVKKILLDQEEIKFISFKSNFDNDYFASDFLNESKSQNKMLLKNLKIKTRSIFNTSVLKQHYKSHPKSILHGVGCAELLYPNHFKVYSLNQCSPISIIADSYLEKNESLSLIIRSSADSLDAPRIVSWRNLFNSVKTYQLIHPLNRWTLHALYN